MPEIDGMTLVRFYRNNPTTRDAPVIASVRKDDPTTKSDAFANGATDYLVKLPEKIELLARIHAYAKRLPLSYSSCTIRRNPCIMCTCSIRSLT